jgi:hypothetical protein
MPSSWISHRMALVRTDVSDERFASIIMMTRISELGTTLSTVSSVIQLLVILNIVPSSRNLYTLVMEALRPPETSALTRPTRCHVPEDGILQETFLKHMFP